MKKLILAFTALSLAAAFTACNSAKEETVETRLKQEYGWKGDALPQAAPDPKLVIVVQEEAPAAPANSANTENAGIVSTSDTKTEAEKPAFIEEPPVPPAQTEQTAQTAQTEQTAKPAPAEKPAPKAEKSTPVFFPRDFELTGETREHLVKKGETLSSIAAAEYKHAKFWGFIFEANRKQLGDNPDMLKPVMKLFVPLIRPKAKKTVAEPAALKPATPEKTAAPEGN